MTEPAQPAAGSDKHRLVVGQRARASRRRAAREVRAGLALSLVARSASWRSDSRLDRRAQDPSSAVPWEDVHAAMRPSC